MKFNNSRIIICSIVRNAATRLKQNIPVIKEVCSHFDDYKVFVYENDSVDDTKKVLNNWMMSDKDHVFVSLNTNNTESTIPPSKDVKANPFYSRQRIEKMVDLRNQYMNFIRTQSWVADYMIVVDLDVAKISADGVLSCFRSELEWDAVTANGYSLGPNLRRRYHDTYALTPYGEENYLQTEDKIKSLASELGRLKPDSDWVRVFSAFGGLAIYRFEAVKGLCYQLIKNNDERVEVKCEHYSIFKQMKECGYDRVYINPKMEIKYQSVTISIIINHLQRKLERIVHKRI